MLECFELEFESNFNCSWISSLAGELFSFFIFLIQYSIYLYML